jgi:hypothetical protein
MVADRYPVNPLLVTRSVSLAFDPLPTTVIVYRWLAAGHA